MDTPADTGHAAETTGDAAITGDTGDTAITGDAVEADEPDGAPTAPSIRSGELLPAWRVASVTVWVLVVFAYSAVWKTSVELGIGTWWLGARSSPQPLLVHLIPFAVAIGFGLVSSYPFRRLPLINVVGALLLAAIAVPDFSRSIGIAVIELVIAGSVLLVAVGSITGVVKTGDR